MPIFSANEKDCQQCGICTSVCVAHIIRGKAGTLPAIEPGDEERCIGCGQCVAFCPHNAVTLEGLPKTRILLEKDALPSVQAMDALVGMRRSIRLYRKKPVPKATLQHIIDLANEAPSAVNKRPVRWLVLQKREQVYALGEMVADGMRAFVAKKPDEAFAPMAEALVNAWEKGLDPFFRGAPQLVCAITPDETLWHWGRCDATIALTYFELAAISFGVGTCWAGYLINTVQGYAPLRTALGLQEGEILAGAHMVGFPSILPAYRVPRPEAPVEWR